MQAPRGYVQKGHIMRWSRGLTIAAAVFSMVVPASVLHGDCNVIPHDQTAENGFGAAPGFTVEYCGLIEPPPECTIDGWFFPVTQGTSFTRTGGQTSLTYTSVIREAETSGSVEGALAVPGPRLVEVPVMITGIQPFPNSSIFDQTVDSPPVLQLVFSCTLLDGDTSSDRFILHDQSLTTPVNPGFGSTDGGPFESLPDLNPSYRALGTSAGTTPFIAHPGGDQMVPPVPSPLIGVVQVSWTGDFQVDLFNSTSSTADISFRSGQAGTNGPVICSFPGASLPFSGSCPDLGTIELQLLITARIYAEIGGDDFSDDPVTIRGQIMPANLLFVDGFETGDIDRWSATSKRP